MIKPLGINLDVAARLTIAFRAAMRGRIRLRHERTGGFMDPKFLPVLMGLIVAVISAFLTLLVVAGVIAKEIALARAGMAFMVGLLLTAMAAILGINNVIDEDDDRAIGWWPIELRDVDAARVGVVLVPTCRAAVGLAALPLAALAALDWRHLLAILPFAVGLALEVIVCAAAPTLVLAWLRRRMGVEWARAAVGGLSVAWLACYFGFAWRFLHTLERDATRAMELLRAVVMDWLPSGWFAAWGEVSNPSSGTLLRLGGSLGLCAVVIVAFCLATPPGVSRRVRRDFKGIPGISQLASLVRWVLAKADASLEGACMRPLLAAHVRADWQGLWLAGLWLVTAATVATSTLVSIPRPLLAVDAAGLRLGVTSGVAGVLLACIMVALLGVVMLSSSRDHEAFWVLCQGEATLAGLLRAERQALRVLVLPALVILAGCDTHQLKIPAWPSALLVIGCFEIGLALAQRLLLNPPFSRPWAQTTRDLLALLLTGLVPLYAVTCGLAWLAVSHAMTLLALLPVGVLAWWLLQRELTRVAGRRVMRCEQEA